MNLDLTICIPTYNRPKLLSECLDSVIDSIIYSNLDVKILISDNFSETSYEDVVNNKLKKYSQITYFKNNENVRDFNFYLCVKRAKTKYVWIFSDDDIMKKNAILSLNTSFSDKDNLILCNYSLYDYNLTKCLKNNFINTNNNSTYKNSDLVMNDFGFRLSFLSCLIFEKDQFLKVPENTYKKYVKFQFPFLLSIYYMIYKNCSFRFIKESLLIQRGNKIHASSEWWYSIFVEGSNKVFAFLNELGYSTRSVRAAKIKLIYSDIIPDIIFRRLNNNSLRNKSLMLIKNYYNYPIQLIILLVSIYTPIQIVKFLLKVYKS
jgi:glycosyltransferase involved in cell wall biosynthesis